MANTFEITLDRNGTSDRQFTLLDANGDGVAIGATDVVRFKLGRGDGVTPNLDLRSGAATDDGSTVTVDQITSPAKATVRFAQGDLAPLPIGIYRGQLGLVDDSETAPADAFKPILQGVVYLIGTPGGPVDKTSDS